MSKQIEVQMRHDHHYVSKLHKRHENTTVNSKVTGETARQEREDVLYRQRMERSKGNKRGTLTKGPGSGDGGRE